MTLRTLVVNRPAKFIEEVIAERVFSASSAAAAAVSAGLPAAYAGGLLLFNPAASGRLLIPLSWKFSHSAAPAAAAAIGIIGGDSGCTPGALMVRRNNLVADTSATVSVGTTHTAAALAPVPTWHYMLQDGFTAGAFPPPTLPYDVQGMWGILPGGYQAIGCSTAVTGFCSVTWIEIQYP